MNNTCHYCSNEFDAEDLRPYGPNGSLVCYPCGTSPEHEKTSMVNFLTQLDAAAAAGQGIVIIGEGTGPRPLNTNSLV